MTQEQNNMFGIKEGDTNKTKMKKMDTFVSNNWRTLQNGARLLGALKYSGEEPADYHYNEIWGL